MPGMNDKEKVLRQVAILYKEGKVDRESFEKALKNVSNLVQKKVQVKGKDGKVYWATRWVDPTTGESQKVIDKKTKIGDLSGGFEERFQKIISSDKSDADKERAMINEGIYDKDLISMFAPSAGVSYF
jgi:hypothetical protein